MDNCNANRQELACRQGLLQACAREQSNSQSGVRGLGLGWAKVLSSLKQVLGGSRVTQTEI